MALGDLYFDVLLRDKTDQGINAIKSKLSKLGVEVGTDIAKGIEAQLKNIKLSGLNASNLNVKATLNVDKNKILTDIQDALSKKQFTIDIKAKSNITTNANKSALAYETEAQAKLINSQARLLQAQIETTKLARQKQMLANATNRATQSARNYTNANRGVIGSLREMTGLAGKFSAIYMGGQFLSSLIRIRGEFEMQLVSLRAIMQSTERANELYGQLMQLSVISPFQFGDLVKYAKQLSAYQIPMGDLYDTTKRLADLSAGLGVGMDRLILAYGQIKSAAVLRGTELRQFTEAGIPMVGALADKFSELEGRVVSAGEVFDKISNREVPFQMVKEVLEDLTSEGGMFFEMQEKQAQTLQGQISNLKDAYAIMMNEIGKSQDGLLKTGVGAIRWSLQNYEELLNILMSVVTAYGAYRIQLGYKTSIMGKDTQATLQNAMAEKQLQATKLGQEALTRKLTAQEQYLISTRGRLTQTDYRLMIANGQLNADQIKTLFLTKKITREQFLTLSARAGMTRVNRLQIANMTQMQIVGERLKLSLTGVGRAFKALGATMKASWPMLVVGLITELIIKFSQLGDEQKRINKEVAENAKMLVSDLSSFFNSHKIAINNIGVGEMSTDEARKFVEKAFEKIEQSAPSGVASIKAEILMEEDDIAQAEKAMEILTSMRNVAEQFSTGAIQWDIPEHFVEEGLADDIADLASEAKEAQKALAGFGLTWEQFFANGVKGAKGEGSTLVLERYKNRLIEVKREVTELVNANMSKFTGKSVEEQKRMYESLFAEVEKMMNDAGLGLESQSHITGIFDSLMNENISGLQYYAASYSKIIDGLSDKDKKEIRSWAGVINEKRRKVLTRMLEDARSKLGGIGISAKQLADDISKLEPILNIKLNIDNKKQTSSVQDAISKAFGRSAVRTPGQARVEKLFEGMTDFSLIEEKIQEEWAGVLTAERPNALLMAS